MLCCVNNENSASTSATATTAPTSAARTTNTPPIARAVWPIAGAAFAVAARSCSFMCRNCRFQCRCCRRHSRRHLNCWLNSSKFFFARLMSSSVLKGMPKAAARSSAVFATGITNISTTYATNHSAGAEDGEQHEGDAHPGDVDVQVGGNAIAHAGPHGAFVDAEQALAWRPGRSTPRCPLSPRCRRARISRPRIPPVPSR